MFGLGRGCFVGPFSLTSRVVFPVFVSLFFSGLESSLFFKTSFGGE